MIEDRGSRIDGALCAMTRSSILDDLRALRFFMIGFLGRWYARSSYSFKNIPAGRQTRPGL